MEAISTVSPLHKIHEDGVAAIRSEEAKEKPVLLPSAGMGGWLRQMGGSLAFSTYQSNRLFFVMADDASQMLAQERIVGPAMGLALDSAGLWVSNQTQVWRFANIGPHTIGEMNADAVFMPRKGYLLGPCDVHDILPGVIFQGQRHELLFVNTHFNCIASLDDNYNFLPIWQPDFITSIRQPDDRCHLNGMGSRDGILTFATLCGRRDTPLGWKEIKANGGVVLDINQNRILCEGLSMPHCPRWHQDRLWVLNSGVGEFGFVQNGIFNSLCLCPGFPRGLCLVDNYAIICVSKMRTTSVGQNISLPERLAAKNLRQMCGLLVIDINTSKLLHWLYIEGIQELFDVEFMPNIRMPFTPGFSLDALHKSLFHFPENELLSITNTAKNHLKLSH